MKTIEEAAKEYVKSLDIAYEVKHLSHEQVAQYAKDDFKAGVAFAEDWISIEDELPELGQWVFVKISEVYGAMKISGETDMLFFKNNVESWRPINRK